LQCNKSIIATQDSLARENNLSVDAIKTDYVLSRNELHSIIKNFDCDNMTPVELQKKIIRVSFFLIKSKNYKHGAICTRLVDYNENDEILMDYYIVIPIKRDGYINYEYRDFCTDSKFNGIAKIFFNKKVKRMV